MSFNVGDRVVINDNYDEFVPCRDQLIGQAGVITFQVPDVPECLFVKMDDPNLTGWGSDGSWAVLAEEVDLEV